MSIYIVTMRQKNKLSNTCVVGIVDSTAALSAANMLSKDSVDCLEWRAGCLPGGLRVPPSVFSWVLTVRHFLEGGKRELSAKKREEIFASHLPAASFVDIELRSFRPLARIIASARDRRIQVVASFHDFKKTPSPGKLRDLVMQAGDQGADIFKIATRTDSPADVGRLLDLFQVGKIPLSVMRMTHCSVGPWPITSQVMPVASANSLHAFCSC